MAPLHVTATQEDSATKQAGQSWASELGSGKQFAPLGAMVMPAYNVTLCVPQIV